VSKKVAEKLPVFYTNLEKMTVHQLKTAQCESSGPLHSKESDGFVDYEILEDGDKYVLDTLDDEDEAHVREVTIKDSKKTKGSKLKTFAVARPDVTSEEEDTNDDGLELSESNEEVEDNHRFKSFRDEDMTNPAFSIGLMFPSVEKVREAINKYSVRNRVEIKMPINDDNIRVKAHCAVQCPWDFYASFDSRIKYFVVKT